MGNGIDSYFCNESWTGESSLRSRCGGYFSISMDNEGKVAD